VVLRRKIKHKVTKENDGVLNVEGWLLVAGCSVMVAGCWLLAAR